MEKGAACKIGMGIQRNFVQRVKNFTKNGITVAITLSLWYTYCEMLWGHPLAQKMN